MKHLNLCDVTQKVMELAVDLTTSQGYVVDYMHQDGMRSNKRLATRVRMFYAHAYHEADHVKVVVVLNGVSGVKLLSNRRKELIIRTPDDIELVLSEMCNMVNPKFIRPSAARRS